MCSALTRFLSGQGPDAAGRTLEVVLALGDERLERHRDDIQWLFPLPEPSRAVPGSPVLASEERRSIQADPIAKANLLRAAAGMRAFCSDNDRWLRAFDHNHLRITRIIGSLGLPMGEEEAEGFRNEVFARVVAAGQPIDRQSIAFWKEALQ